MYILNDAIRALGESVIAEHEELAHLKHPVAPCRIAYMYSDKDKSHRGRTVYADTTKVSEMMQALTGYDFLHGARMHYMRIVSLCSFRQRSFGGVCEPATCSTILYEKC